MVEEWKMITAESIPNHDGWGPDAYWSCTDWITWHKALVLSKGSEEADRLWVNEYDKSSWGAHEISCSTNSNEFKDYVLANGIAAKSSILSRVYRAELAVDGLIEETFAPVTNLWKSTATVTKWIPYVVAVIVIGGVVYVLANYGKVAKMVA